jgi:exodeoxyribonuclease V gamma subunit
MQPFASRLFLPDGHAQGRAEVFTYREGWLEAARSDRRRAAPVPFVDAPWSAPDEEAPVELDELRRFLRNPAGHFLRWQAGIALDTASGEVDEREPLVLDPLEQGRLDRALAGLAVTGSDAGPVRENLRARGLLPPLQWGRGVYEATRQALAPGLHHMRDWQAAHRPRPPRVFRLDLGRGRVLQGVLEGLHEGGFGAWIGNAHSASGWLQWWLGALVVVALEEADACVAWGRDTDKAAWSLPWRPAMPGRDEARERLTELVDTHRAGQREPLPLPLRTAHAWARAHVVGEDAAKALRAAVTTWDGGYNAHGEKSDPWFALAFRGRELFDGAAMQERFQALATTVHVPLCRALNGGRAP